MSASKEGKEKKPVATVVKIVEVESIAPSKDKRPTRMKLLNDVSASSPQTSPTKADKRSGIKGSRIKILNEDVLVAPKVEKRRSTKPTSPGASSTSTVKILNEKRIVPAEESALETTKIKISPPKRNKMDHYVLQPVKVENSKSASQATAAVTGDDEDTMAFILGDDDEVVPASISRSNGQEILVTEEEEEEEEDDLDEEGDSPGGSNKNSGPKAIKEIVEHVCGKCYKTFRRLMSLKKHLEFCRYDSGYHLRKAEMLKNLEKIEKDAIVLEKKDICFCCCESYDTFHVSIVV